jgi:hypothetical protein
MNDPMLFATLRAFRAGVYRSLGARRDALFEALDAATTAGPVPSLPYLSLAALHRRGWGSLYAALAEGSAGAAAGCRGRLARAGGRGGAPCAGG